MHNTQHHPETILQMRHPLCNPQKPRILGSKSQLESPIVEEEEEEEEEPVNSLSLSKKKDKKDKKDKK